MQVKVLSEMVKVGHDLLERGIVDDPRMIDIGMIWGTGFPADRGRTHEMGRSHRTQREALR